jgi:hypothetical protein
MPTHTAENPRSTNLAPSASLKDHSKTSDAPWSASLFSLRRLMAAGMMNCPKIKLDLEPLPALTTPSVDSV